MPRLAEYEDEVYAITKAYSLRSELLDRNFFKLAVGFSSVEELAERLRSTRYGRDMGGQKFSSAKELEKALMGSLIDMHYRMMLLYSCNGMLPVLFNRYISWDIKAVLRGKASGLSYEGIMDSLYIRAEERLGRRDLIARAAAAKDLGGAVVGLSGTEYYAPAQDGLKLFESTGDPVVFDLAIDKFTAERISAAVSEREDPSDMYAGKLVLSAVDEYNLGVAMRYQALGLTPSQATGLLISKITLYLDYDRLRRMISEAAPASSYADMIRRSPYSDYLLGESVDQVIGAVYNYRLHEAEASWAAAPMDYPVLISLVILVENEVRNLSAVAFGIENGMSREALSSLLRFPS